MQERRATVLGHTHDLTQPIFVLATQTPIELEVTYATFAGGGGFWTHGVGVQLG